MRLFSHSVRYMRLRIAKLLGLFLFIFVLGATVLSVSNRLRTFDVRQKATETPLTCESMNNNPTACASVPGCTPTTQTFQCGAQSTEEECMSPCTWTEKEYGSCSEFSNSNCEKESDCDLEYECKGSENCTEYFTAASCNNHSSEGCSWSAVRCGGSYVKTEEECSGTAYSVSVCNGTPQGSGAASCYWGVAACTTLGRQIPDSSDSCHNSCQQRGAICCGNPVVNYACENNEFECLSDTEFRTCSDDRSKWLNGTCADGKTCSSTEQRCIDPETNDPTP